MSYAGVDLQLMAEARNWKAYFTSQIRPFLGSNVAEIGAGLGETSQALLSDGKGYQSWQCLEPEAQLYAHIQEKIDKGQLPAFCQAISATVEQLPPASCDTILYIDVLEHIEHDRQELSRASQRLKTGGHLIVLCPAHQFLFSPFDQEIGHFRRYNKETLSACGPSDCQLYKIFYLDSLGFFLSWANSYFLRQSMPTPRQIWFWDRCIVPVSRYLDALLGYRFGKTVVAVWRK